MAEDVYDSDYLEAMMENDELSPSEEGIMHWYDHDAEKSFQVQDPFDVASLNDEDNYPII